MSRQYTQRDPVPENIAKVLEGYDPLTQSLLFHRGIQTKEGAEHFLEPDFESHLHDPFLLNDMDVAVERILKAIKENENIVVYSDYDCDGIPGGALLHDFFTAIGYEHFSNYIPHRHEEGYGLNVEAIEKLAGDGTKLIITVDCGITDTAQIDRANELGVDVILTDHHEPNSMLPKAVAVLNPKRADSTYPFRELCGSGVAFKLVSALITRGKEEQVFELKDGWEKWWLDVVGLATIADLVPLQGENRVLARYGLFVIQKGRRLGLQHLLRTMRMKAQTISEDDIGYMIAPRINAASRMDNPEDALKLLTATTEEEAGAYARHLDKMNNERKGVVAAMVKEIKKRLKQTVEMGDVLVVGNPNWRPALVGLAANSLAEEYKRPAFVWGRDGRDVIKGSCRSDGTMSVVELMNEAKNVFIEYGGHHYSGGFSVHGDHIHTFGDQLNDAYKVIKKNTSAEIDTEKDNLLDGDLTLRDVTESTYRIIEKLSPFGVGNPKPLFRFLAVAPDRVEVFGKGKDHMKLVFEREGDKPLEAIGFFSSPESFQKKVEEKKNIDLIAHIEKSHFMNRPQLRLRIVDVL